MSPNDETVTRLREEVAHLRARIEELERERLEHDRRALAAVTAAQERAYWLDRWHLDLNDLVDRPAVDRARAVARGVRGPVRALRGVVRRLGG